MHPGFRRRSFRGLSTPLAAALLILLVFTLSTPLAQDQIPMPAPGQDPDEWIASMMAMPAWTFYPDDRVLGGFSGFLQITLSAGGSFELPPTNEPEDTNTVSGQLHGTITYVNTGGHETTLVSFHSELVETYLRAARQEGDILRPQRERRYVHRITGRDTAAAPLRIANLHFSPGMKLSSFQMQMGPLEARNVITGLTRASETWEDGELTDRLEMESEFHPRVPSGGAGPSRWAQAVAGPRVRSLSGTSKFFYESASVNGETAGTLVFPIYTDGYMMLSPPETFTERGEDPAAPPVRADSALFPGTAEVRWSFVMQADPGEMTIEPAEPDLYASWIPLPMPEDGHPAAGPEVAVPDDPNALVTAFRTARPLLVTARLRPKRGETTAPKGRIHFHLRDVSRHRGICNNFPADGGDTAPDLFFVPRSGITINADDPMHAYSDSNVSELTVAIGARDTAAFGVLQAYCDDLGLIALNERTGRHGLVIPLDDNQNRIADAWEHQMGLRDVPGHHYLAGDGLTVFEAYRGFMTPEGFVRVDPRAPSLQTR